MFNNATLLIFVINILYCYNNNMSCIQNTYRKYYLYNHVYLLSYFMCRKRVNALWLITLALVEENGRCSTDHIIQWRINRNVILYNLFSNTKDNKNSASTLFSYLGYSSSVFVYTGFRNSATTLTLLCNSSCSGHVILAQILLDGPCFRFCETEKVCRTGWKKKITFSVRECSRSMWKHP